jgi:hypothetical protein
MAYGWVAPGLFELDLAEYVNGPFVPPPKAVLGVPSRVERKPPAGENNIERILVWPYQVATTIERRLEQ